MSQPTTGGTPGQFGYNDLGQIIAGNNNTNYILAFMLGALQQMIGSSGGGTGGGITVNNPIVTPNFALLTAGQSQFIPAGAKGWTATILTGTGTVGGKTVPSGFSDSDPNTLAASVTVTTDSPGTAYVRWNT